ncbi:NAD-dependent epimerase/dehydratase family protein [Echinimonas agarilytica]|uniref:SDR family oxidoreductase n=1 Tax=Echinimonas agarilytica TaxID=1215918 RepID=A0AA42B6M0_9GAMM|nr:SDR family oxidoreductase [Echinimonas agarilytica]MCM2678952.1 SDR family oxidoreductase [Echinimonas agarilytica]
MMFTIFGSTGYIGSELVKHLCSLNVPVQAIARGDSSWKSRSLGHVIYAVGLTAGFREHPEKSLEAHAGLLSEILCHQRFDSLTYLSSTRLYGLQSERAAKEDDAISIRPSLSGVYDSSKLLGESLCLAQSLPTVRVARLSNVFGVGQPSNVFLPQVLSSLRESGQVEIGEAPDSSKDYISIDDVVKMLVSISQRGQHRIYNVASGHNVTHLEIAHAVEKFIPNSVKFAAQGQTRKLASIDIARIHDEFNVTPKLLLPSIEALLKSDGFANTMRKI